MKEEPFKVTERAKLVDLLLSKSLYIIPNRGKVEDKLEQSNSFQH